MKKSTKGKNLGVFLAIGESLADFQAKGQLQRLIGYNVKYYLKEFEKIYIFSYSKEKCNLPKNCVLVPNKYNLHRYIYAIMMPILEAQNISKCATVRALQLTGGIPALISKILLNKPYVVNFGYDYEYYAKIEGKYIQAFLYKLLKYPILKNSAKVIVTSRNIKKYLKFINNNQVVFLPNGVSLKLFKKNKTKKTADRCRIIFIGRLEKQKNLSNLIMACTTLNFDYELLFFGEGKLKKYLLNLGQRLGVNLTINKPVNYFKVPQVLNSATIFTLPSEVEGNPKILLEAMACECKIVATDVSGIKELIKDKINGYLSKLDSQSLADTLRQALSSKKNVGHYARQTIVKGYDIDDLLKKEATLLANTK